MNIKESIELLADTAQWEEISKCLSEAEDLNQYAVLLRNTTDKETLLQILARHKQDDLVRALIACNNGEVYLYLVQEKIFSSPGSFTYEFDKDKYATREMLRNIINDLRNLISKIAEAVFFPDESNPFHQLPLELKKHIIIYCFRSQYSPNLPKNIEKHLFEKVLLKSDELSLEKFKARELNSICKRSFWFYVLNKGTLVNSEWISAHKDFTLIHVNKRISTQKLKYRIQDAIKGNNGFWLEDLDFDMQEAHVQTGVQIVQQRQVKLFATIRKGFSKHTQQFDNRLFGVVARDLVVNRISQSDHIDFESCSEAFAEAAKCLPSAASESVASVVIDAEFIKAIKMFAKECAKEHQCCMGTRYSGFWASDAGSLVIAKIIAETLIILARQGKIPQNFANDEHVDKRKSLSDSIERLKVIDRSQVSNAVESVFNSEKSITPEPQNNHADVALTLGQNIN